MDIKQRFDDVAIGSGKHFTEPNQSYTVRQIIDQFSRGELMAKTFDPTDVIDDSNYSEEDLEKVINFEDEFDALNHLQENEYQLRKEEHESVETPSEGNKGDSKEEND